MSLQFRRGTSTQKNALTSPLASGEPLWVTDQGLLYVGDGITPTASLQPVSGYSDTNAKIAASQMLINGATSGITFTWNPSTQTINSTVTYTPNTGILSASKFIGSVYDLAGDSTPLVDAATKTHHGFFKGDFEGNILADNSTILINGATGHITGQIYSQSNSLIVDSYTSNVYGNFFGSLYYQSSPGSWALLVDASTGHITAASSNVLTSLGSSTSANMYISYVTNTDGTQPLYTNTSLSFKPSTGRLTATSFAGDLYSTTGTKLVDATAGNVVCNVYSPSASVVVDATARIFYGSVTGTSSGVPVYSTTAARDTALPNGTVVMGMMCFVSSTTTLYLNTSGTISGWVVIS
jgi:hypothetical protein